MPLANEPLIATLPPRHLRLMQPCSCGGLCNGGQRRRPGWCWLWTSSKRPCPCVKFLTFRRTLLPTTSSSRCQRRTGQIHGVACHTKMINARVSIFRLATFVFEGVSCRCLHLSGLGGYRLPLRCVSSPLFDILRIFNPSSTSNVQKYPHEFACRHNARYPLLSSFFAGQPVALS